MSYLKMFGSNSQVAVTSIDIVLLSYNTLISSASDSIILDISRISYRIIGIHVLKLTVSVLKFRQDTVGCVRDGPVVNKESECLSIGAEDRKERQVLLSKGTELRQCYNQLSSH
jgi:hypothetical protein